MKKSENVMKRRNTERETRQEETHEQIGIKTEIKHSEDERTFNLGRNMYNLSFFLHVVFVHSFFLFCFIFLSFSLSFSIEQLIKCLYTNSPSLTLSSSNSEQ